MTALGLGPRASGGGERGRSEEETVDAEEEGVEAQDFSMADSTMPTTTATPTPTATATATASGTGIELKNGTEAAAPNILSDPTQLRQVIRMDHGRARNCGGMESGCGVSARPTERKSRNRNQLLGI